MSMLVELRKMQGKHADVLKMGLSADDLAALATAVLPVHVVRMRDVLVFCCHTGLRYPDVWASQLVAAQGVIFGWRTGNWGHKRFQSVSGIRNS